MTYLKRSCQMVVTWMLLKQDNPFFDKVQTITTLAEQYTDEQTLQTINTHLGITIGLIKCHSEQMKSILPLIQLHEPVNKAVTLQQLFLSTDKRRKTQSVRLPKLKYKEKEETKKN